MGRLTGCCCCFNLRDGSKAIGITLLVLGSLGLIGQIIGTATLAAERPLARGEVASVSVQIIFSIIGLVFNSLLVHGVEHNNRGMLLAWVIYSGITTGLASLGVLAGFIIFCIFGVLWAVLLMLVGAGVVGLLWYWFVVVLHCYLEMRQENGLVYGKQENEGEGHAL